MSTIQHAPSGQLPAPKSVERQRSESGAPALPLLTAADLGKQLQLSETTIVHRRARGASLPRAIKVGHLVRWRQADVDAWLEAHLEPLPGGAAA